MLGQIWRELLPQAIIVLGTLAPNDWNVCRQPLVASWWEVLDDKGKPQKGEPFMHFQLDHAAWKQKEQKIVTYEMKKMYIILTASMS